MSSPVAVNVRPSHTFLGGLVAGLVLDKETLVVLVIGVFLGAGLVLAGRLMGGIVRGIRGALDRG